MATRTFAVTTWATVKKTHFIEINDDAANTDEDFSGLINQVVDEAEHETRNQLYELKFSVDSFNGSTITELKG
jgi:hypothetical protein